VINTTGCRSISISSCCGALYRDFLRPLLFGQGGDRLPITTGANSLPGQFLMNGNLIAAGATITVIPTLVIYLALRRHFVAVGRWGQQGMTTRRIDGAVRHAARRVAAVPPGARRAGRLRRLLA
jgi:hypothetical protein